MECNKNDSKNNCLPIYEETKGIANTGLAQFKREENQALEKKPEGNNKFEHVADEWLKFARIHLKLSSISQYTYVLDYYLLPAFRGKDITLLKREDISALAGRLMISGGNNNQGLSAATVLSIINVAKNIFLFASREKGLPVADIHGIPIKQTKKTPEILDETEQSRLEKALIKNINPCSLGILICLYTGIRIGEICALKWGDISKNDQSIHILRTIQRIRKNNRSGTEVMIFSPKSDSSVRHIPVPKHIKGLLVQCRQEDTSWLLTSDPERFMEPRLLQYRFKAMLESCEIRRVNFHVLRHTFATRCIELGFDLKTLSEIMGHSDVSMTISRYVHPTMAQKQKNMDKLNFIFEGS